MADYFVRISGSDAAAGTSAALAWRTIGKALGAAGIASGDRVFIGAGVYREAVTVAMTSAVAETSIIGDVDGAQTGDAGEVIWTNYTNGWHDTPSGSYILDLDGRDFLTLRYLTMIAGAAGGCIRGVTAHSTNITVDQCYLQAVSQVCISYTGAFATAANWTITKSYLCSSSYPVFIVLPTGVGADYDANIQISDCFFINTFNGVQAQSSGTAANEGGGVDVKRCIGVYYVLGTTGTRMSLTIPCTIEDSIALASGFASAGEVGAVIDNGGNVSAVSNTNVTAHATSKTSTEDFPALAISLGHEWLFGMQPRKAFSPLRPAVYARGHIGTTNTDIESRARPEGTGLYIDGGTASAGAATTMTDGGKAWKTNEHVGRLVRTTGGTGSGQVKHISSNTATVLTIGGLDGDWATTPDTTTTYIIYEGPPVTTGKATGGTTTTVDDAGAAWSVNKWAGYSCAITAGTNSGETRTISSNTATQLTTAAYTAAIDATSVYSVFWPGASLTANGDHPGAFEYHDSAQKETTTTDAGSVGITIEGPGSHEFLIPVDAASTTITVKTRYDANHGTTNKPQAILLANGEIGVTTETKTATAAADTWDTLTFTAQTPTAKGVVTVRLVSRSDTPYGRCYFDTWTVT